MSKMKAENISEGKGSKKSKGGTAIYGLVNGAGHTWQADEPASRVGWTLWQFQARAVAGFSYVVRLMGKQDARRESQLG